MYASHPWDFIKLRGHENDDVVRLVYEVESWLLVDDYLQATTVVGSLALEKDLQISNDFMAVTEWPDLVVWPFRSNEDREQFEGELNKVLYSFMTSGFASVEYLSQKIFRYEKRADMKVRTRSGGHTFWEFPITPPFDRYRGEWRWAEIVSYYNYPIDLDGDLVQTNILVIKNNFADAKVDPVARPNTRAQRLSEVGGQYVRAMGRLALMRKVAKLGNLLQDFPIRVRGG